jgi:hypothetical protein
MYVTAVLSLAPSAVWADAASVAAAIDAYGNKGLKAAVSGDAVTVTGAEAGAKTPLSLDITGVNVVWNATLSGDFNAAASKSALLIVSGGGSFNVSPSGVIFSDAPAETAAVELRDKAALTVNGTVKAAGSNATAIYSKQGAVTVEKGGKVQSPRGSAIRTYDHGGIDSGLSTVTLNDKAGLAGEVALVEASGRYVSTFYGVAAMDFDRVYSSRDMRPLIVVAEDAELTLTRSAHFTEEPEVDMYVRNRGTLISDGTVVIGGLLENEGQIVNRGQFTNKRRFNNKGEFVNEGTFVNDYTLANESGGRVVNSGQFTNTRTFENKGEFVNLETAANDGTLINEGRIDTIDGKIVNNGFLDNSRGKIDGGSNIQNRGQGRIRNPRKDDDGGCDAGLGLAGLAALAGAGIFGCSMRRKDK